MVLKTDQKFPRVSWETQKQWNFITTGQLMFPLSEYSGFMKSQPKTHKAVLFPSKLQRTLHPQDSIKKMAFFFFFLSPFCMMIEKYNAARGPAVHLWPDLSFWNGVKQKAISPSSIPMCVNR